MSIKGNKEIRFKAIAPDGKTVRKNMSVKCAAQLLGCSEVTVFQYSKLGKVINGYRIARVGEGHVYNIMALEKINEAYKGKNQVTVLRILKKALQRIRETQDG